MACKVHLPDSLPPHTHHCFSRTVLGSPRPWLGPGCRSRNTDWPFPRRFPVLLPIPALLHPVSLSPSSTAVSAHLPPNVGVIGFVNCGCLRALETGCVQEPLALRCLCHLSGCGESCPAQAARALRTPLVHSSPNPAELVTNSLVHGTAWGHWLLRHVLLEHQAFVALLCWKIGCSESTATGNCCGSSNYSINSGIILKRLHCHCQNFCRKQQK